jgi:hypothetical protein
MDEVSLSGVQFNGSVRTELNKDKTQFTVLVEHGVVNKGLTSANALIGVSGELVFKVVKGKSTSPNLNQLTSLERGTLFIRATMTDEIKLKLTLPKHLDASQNTFKYEVTKATGAYKGTKGHGELAFLTFFPSDTLGKNSGNCRAALT